jgi:hypothetical protein
MASDEDCSAPLLAWQHFFFILNVHPVLKVLVHHQCYRYRSRVGGGWGAGHLGPCQTTLTPDIACLFAERSTIITGSIIGQHKMCVAKMINT